MSIERRENRVDFREMSLQLWDPSKRSLTLCEGFLHEESIILLGVRLILYVV